MNEPAGDATASHAIDVRVRYAETDQMGVVYYANYFVWFELGRTEWIRAHGVTYREFEDYGIFLPVLEAGCSYAAACRYDDLVRVTTTVTRLTAARLAFEYTVTRDDGGVETLLARGHTAHAFLSREGKLVRLNRNPALWARLTGAFSAAAQSSPSSSSPPM